MEDCFRNYHPVYHIKAMMIKRELERDPALQNEPWERFLPRFKKQNVQRKKKKTKAARKEYTPFPPAPTPRKVDLQIESGEYFLSTEQKRARQLEARQQKQADASAVSAAKREERFVPPKESRPAAGAGARGKRKEAERSAAEIAGSLVQKEAEGRKRRARGGQGA